MAGPNDMTDQTDIFDVVVLGSGPGGYVAALEAGRLGARVAVVEKSPHVGGTCLNYGCIPSKALLASGEMLHRIRHADQLGIEVAGEVGFDWKKIQKRKDKILRQLRGGVKSLFKGRGVTLVNGRGTLAGPGKVLVVADDGSQPRELTAGKIILAVGSEPARIPGWPTDPDLVCTSDEALHWKTLPGSLLIVGGGVIGCEFACMLEPFGVDVTVVEMMPRLLPEMDAELGQAMAKTFQQRGVKVFVDTKVDDVASADGGLSVVLGGGEPIRVDRVLVAVGRRPATGEIGLDTVGLSTDRGFVRVNDRMETPAADVYCIGDANGRCLLAHAASAHGHVAAANALGAAKSFDAPMPSCVYTFPEVAAVGMTQEQARSQSIPVSVGTFPLGHLGKTMAVGETDGFAKVLRHRESGELLGVHMMGHNVTEVIASAGVMLGRNVPAADVAEIVFAHPTVSEAVKEAVEDTMAMALHLPPRKVIRIAAGG